MIATDVYHDGLPRRGLGSILRPGQIFNYSTFISRMSLRVTCHYLYVHGTRHKGVPSAAYNNNIILLSKLYVGQPFFLFKVKSWIRESPRNSIKEFCKWQKAEDVMNKFT